MSKDVIGQLPLTPREDNVRVGYYMASLAADVMGKISGEETLYAANVLGDKVSASKDVTPHIR